MNVVWHQTPAPDGDIGGTAVLHEQVPVKLIIAVAEKHLGATIAALSDMMRKSRDDNTSETSHRRSLAKSVGGVK